MMKPHIPLLAQDQVSSGLRLSSAVSLSSFFAVSVRPFHFNHFKAERGKTTAVPFANYRAFVVNDFY